MLNTIKQNKKAVLAFLLALVMLIGIIPFTATEVQAVTIPVGDITTNNSFGNGDAWETGDKIRLLRWADDRHTNFFLTAEVTEDGAVTWTPDKKLYWDGKGEHTLVASYPNMNLLFQNFGIPVDQSDLQKLKEADCMNAMWKGDPTTDPIDLTLKHRLSMVTVTYIFASEFADEPDITPEVYTNTQYVFFNVNTLERQEVAWEDGYDAWVKAYKHNEVDDEGNVTARKFTAIVSPDAYTAGDEFIRIKIGDQVLTAKMPNDISFEEGTHYAFDLKVGKDAVTIEQVSVNGNLNSPFGDGWRSDTEEDLGAVSITDIQDEGKTAWDYGDQIIATLTSQRYGEQTAMLTFSGSDGTWSTDESFSYLENETPTVKAVYAPSNILGTGEYIEFDCELNGEKLTVKLESATRNYSRLRIVGLPNQTLTVTTTEFTPAGATSAATDSYTLTTDENGNAFLYGTFAENATIVIKQGNVVLKEYAFHAEKFPGGTEQGKSYVLGAMPVIDGTLGGKTTATEEEVNALVEQLKAYVDNGITTIVIPGTEYAMYKSNLGTIPAFAEALYLLTDNSQEESQYRGTIDLILPDATEIIDYSFDSVDALKSITLPKVTTVGDGAFYGCQYLEKMTFGSVITEVVEIKSGVFASLGTKSDNEACDLVLNCGQLNAEDKYKPNLESNVWYIGEWSGETEWKSITLIHTGECDECKAQ